MEVLAAQQTPESPSWFEGTADAVRQYRELFEAWDVNQIQILSGDRLYRMEYAALVEAHRASGAALTVAALPLDADTAQGFGLMRTDARGTIHWVLGLRLRVEDDVVLRVQRASLRARGGVALGIGRGSMVTGAIHDKNVRIGRNVQVIHKDRVQESEGQGLGFTIRSGDLRLEAIEALGNSAHEHRQAGGEPGWPPGRLACHSPTRPGPETRTGLRPVPLLRPCLP